MCTVTVPFEVTVWKTHYKYLRSNYVKSLLKAAQHRGIFPCVCTGYFQQICKHNSTIEEYGWYDDYDVHLSFSTLFASSPTQSRTENSTYALILRKVQSHFIENNDGWYGFLKMNKANIKQNGGFSLFRIFNCQIIVITILSVSRALSTVSDSYMMFWPYFSIIMIIRCRNNGRFND